MGRLGKIGVYSSKTRGLQRKLSYEVFGLTWKTADVYLYQGDRSNASPDIDDIHTTVFNEVPDRAYSLFPINIPVGMEPLPEQKTDFSRFGIVDLMQDETMFRVHIDDFETLGRELITGDVFSMEFFSKPGETSFWEINDVDKASEYEKFIAIIHASPLGDKRTTREIPIDNSNEGILDGVIDQAESEATEQVPDTEVTFDETNNPVPEGEVDYRNKTQSSFLDDPTKEF